MYTGPALRRELFLVLCCRFLSLVNTAASVCMYGDETLPQCRATDYDDGPALNKHVVMVVCLQWATALISRLIRVYENCREKNRQM